MSDRTTGTTEPHAGIAHPTVVARLLEEMESMSNNVDQHPAATFADDTAWTTLERLIESLETLRLEAELHRPSLSGLA